MMLMVVMVVMIRAAVKMVVVVMMMMMMAVVAVVRARAWWDRVGFFVPKTSYNSYNYTLPSLLMKNSRKRKSINCEFL